MLTELIRNKHLSSRTVRKLVKGISSHRNTDYIFQNFLGVSDYDRLCKSFDAIISLRIAIKRLVTITEKIEDK
jgi:hypothetical protein